jgi:hypothetical protein
MKAGTTSLAAWLRAHGEVFVPADKELHFFDRFWDRGVDWYRAQLAEAPPRSRVGEATPEYMVHEAYLARISAVVPEVRLIALLRNPIDRAWSQYRHMVARGERAWLPYRNFDGREGPRSFAELIDLELALDPSDWRTSGMCLARGRYIEQFNNMAAHFDREQIHVALFDELVDEPEESFATICRFLSVDPDVRPAALGEEFDPLRMMGSRARADDVRGLLNRPPGKRGTIGEVRVEKGQPPVELRRSLVEYFRPYNDELAVWLGVDLSSWNR